MKTNTGQETKKAVETAILVALIHKRQPQDRAKEYLEELAFLASTAGVETLAWFTQKVDHPDRRTFIGKGKLEEIQAYVTAHSVNRVIFDDDLSPSQLKNLENELKVRIYDRSLLILEIFMNRAQTAQARTQVELARYQYLLPRLTRMWTHLERQRGGTGTRGGSGEKEIETDKRVIRDQITLLKEKLKKIDMQNATQRKSRTDIVRVALVGYTNVGKSTLMNLLSKSDVFAENKLFATVDATVRKINYLNIPYLLSDTVGFIRKLPTTLIESFKSTLDEVREADILIHVVDISHPSFEEHIEVVNATLADIKAADKPVILVFNKIDQYHPEVEQSELDGEKISEAEVIKASLEQLKSSYLNKNQFATVFISATQRENIDELREIIGQKVKEKHLMIYPNYLIY
ncbi:GTPase HflX [Sporocytophaga myxococcoides]|uniref:GTPase HflX n=1 Tax=Sporocytophaga myxococcoides TaxID=153721 RepID=A0A098LL22_9BACT|nr:GTPase HflX [Sporocytophaga myxococcoides]GAL87087.1 GTPase HflX [Sporocytophaga myxococcoides]